MSNDASGPDGIREDAALRAAAAAGALSRSVGRRARSPHHRREGGAGLARDHPRSSLSARRGDQVRRLHRRLVPPGPGGGEASGSRIHRVLRRPLHGRERRRALRPAPESDPARPRGRLLDGRHGGDRSARDRLGRNVSIVDRPSSIVDRPSAIGHAICRHSRHLHQLVGGHQGVCRRAWRHRLHLVELRPRRCAGRGSAASTILFLPDQHLGRNTAYKMGVPLDEMVVWDPNEIPAAAPSTMSATRR